MKIKGNGKVSAIRLKHKIFRSALVEQRELAREFYLLIMLLPNITIWDLQWSFYQEVFVMLIRRQTLVKLKKFLRVALKKLESMN